MNDKDDKLRPVAALAGQKAYRVARPRAPIDVYLDGNEGAEPGKWLLETLAQASTEVVRDYPKAPALEAMLAARLGVDVERVLVTAGADDALDRICRAMLEPGRNMVLPEPTFEMLGRYATLAKGEVRSVAWPSGPYPIEAVLGAVDAQTTLILVVSPNNPTGAVATGWDLGRLAEAAPHALIVVDHAYVEFTDIDLTAQALTLPNVVVVRTLSKAWGMAGLRVGYVAASARVMEWLRIAGHPYAVSGPSLALAAARLEAGDEAVTAFVARIKQERAALVRLLEELGGRPLESQANFVLCAFDDASFVRDGLAGLGFAVRIFEGKPGLEGRLRITCPGDPQVFARLEDALRTILAPQALLLDMDGVIADVSGSYRQSIIDTAAHFGVMISAEDVSKIKAKGSANNDWDVTQRLLAARGVQVNLAEVTERFEAIYQGSEVAPGLRATETLLTARGFLEDLAARLPMGIVTGRPRTDALRFLEEHGIAHCFRAVVCMEDAPLKPDPAPLRLCVQQLGCSRAWMVGDTPDDVRAARSMGALGLGVVAPGEDIESTVETLIRSGAGRVLRDLAELKELLP